MAGRPLRRARMLNNPSGSDGDFQVRAPQLLSVMMRRNPLVHWELTSPLPATLGRVSILLRNYFNPKQGEAMWARKLLKVPLNIAVIVGPGFSRSERSALGREQVKHLTQEYLDRLRAADTWARQNNIVVFARDYAENDWRSDAGHKDDFFAGISTMDTPFQNLHNLAEVIMGFGDLEEEEGRQQEYEIEQLIATSSNGVDTAAGRLGRLTLGSQIAADLFAKYLLTGQIALLPRAVEAGALTTDQLSVAFKSYFDVLIRHLQQNPGVYQLYGDVSARFFMRKTVPISVFFDAVRP